MPATPAYRWPLIEARAGGELWVKYDNATPTGAFKVRGGIVYFNRLRDAGAQDVICASTGNHGQSVAYNAARIGVKATIVIPHGNSREKNAAMRAFGATLVEHGTDFQSAFEHARALAQERNLHFVESFSLGLIPGVASLGLELFDVAGELDVVYVPIGLGSGVCSMLAARDALGLRTEIIGVISEGAPMYALSLAQGRPIEAPVNTFSDGIACRLANADALRIIREKNVRLVRVSDEETREAMRVYYESAHCLAEPSGAASLAAALKDARPREARAAVVMTGANVDREIYLTAIR